MVTGLFHEGELAVQQRAGEAQLAERNGAVIGHTIPRGAMQFIRQQPMAVLGTQDKEGRLWASLLFGKPGFLDLAGDGRSLRVLLSEDARLQADPFWSNLAETRRFGLLVIDLGSRRRLRVNGRAASVSAGELVLDVEEAYPNCPKYIQRRHLRQASGAPSIGAGSHREGSLLEPEQTTLIRNADTFFVATAHATRNLDVSHRGGNPGFVKVLDEATLRIPDYQGNGMFNTLGNLALNRNASLVFPDFEQRRILQLGGAADILWDHDDPENETGGTGRYWQFHLESWLETDIPNSVAFEFLDYSPFNPLPDAMRLPSR
jgi:predicted pyridoxine 5'-phosphate oxidase superfamily flavin-nucleotide-binding protein